jgi:hypothetical protein
MATQPSCSPALACIHAHGFVELAGPGSATLAEGVGRGCTQARCLRTPGCAGGGLTRGTERRRPRRAARIVSYVRGDGAVRWFAALPTSPAAASHQPPSLLLLYGRRLLGCARGQASRGRSRTEGLVQETSIFLMRSPQGTTQRRHCSWLGDRRNRHLKVQFFSLVA